MGLADDLRNNVRPNDVFDAMVQEWITALSEKLNRINNGERRSFEFMLTYPVVVGIIDLECCKEFFDKKVLFCRKVEHEGNYCSITGYYFAESELIKATLHKSDINVLWKYKGRRSRDLHGINADAAEYICISLNKWAKTEGFEEYSFRTINFYSDENDELTWLNDKKCIIGFLKW